MALSKTKFHPRQIISRETLDRLSASDNPSLEAALNSLNSEVTPPLELRASEPNDLTLNVGSIIVENPETDVSKTISPFRDGIPDFSSGSITLPAASGSDIVVTPGDNVELNITSDNFIKAIISLTSEGNLTVTLGEEAATEAAAELPTPSPTALALGFLVIHNDSGTIQNVSNANIYQFMTGGGGSGMGRITTGSPAEPITIIAAEGITKTPGVDETIYIESTTQTMTISATPQISNGDIIGEMLYLVGTDSDNFLILENGNGLALNGNWESFQHSTIALQWDGSVWAEVNRSY